VAIFEVYKRGQGKYTRIITLFSAMALGVIGAGVLGGTLEGRVNIYLQYGIPVAVVLALGAGMLWIVNRPKSADFLIATEGEMKKVSWSSKKEIIGSTKVVIVTTFILAAVLFCVDITFKVLFQMVGLWPKIGTGAGN